MSNFRAPLGFSSSKLNRVCHILSVNPFWTRNFYLLIISLLGFWSLNVLKPRTNFSKLRNLDLFFTSVSATTLSSMSTIEMEILSNPQLIVVSILMFIGGEVVLFFAMEWNSKSLKGLNPYEKTIGVLFQSVNTRQAGETIVNLPAMSTVILVVITVIMYLPPYTSFPFVNDEEEQHQQQKRKRKIAKKLLSQLAYISIFVILICITERKSMKEDPLNFTPFNIVFEVISAYGNVGYTMGYNCKLRLKDGANCEDKWYGFVGKWSDAGKTILIAVMLFGRLKRYNMGWKFS
ncbi:hypothetical protein J1N35_042407 [Gossypium stocksii]|uniref:Uncharacterized protein n=1 Tax=Gossypium stocksii TaxID=47602 RepID=A0A9D3ZKK4_9ROSI|nr:hypothetical protein J1N35_042407 [Gossypium stocksii]